jgi:hypothetical protein
MTEERVHGSQVVGHVGAHVEVMRDNGVPYYGNDDQADTQHCGGKVLMQLAGLGW